MSTVAADTTSEAYAQFGKWLTEQPFWLQDATYRIYTGKKIDDEQIRLYAEICVAQSKGETPAYNHLTPSDLVRSKGDNKISVLSLSDIHGVNALADNASLDFSEQGVSIIYGLNGAGKSGYMRVFKHLSGSPYKEPIQPNIFKKVGAETPSCKVIVSQEGEQREAAYDLSSKQSTSLLSVCDVFDTRISNQYISSTNNVSYQPFVFTVLSELAPIADRISKYISALKETVSETTVIIPNELASSAHLQWVVCISKSTVIPKECLVWDEAKEKEHKTLPQLLDTDSVKKQLKLATTARNALTPICEDICVATESFNRERFEVAYQELTTAKRRYEAAQLLFSETANEQDQISVDSEDWKTLWSSAKNYYESLLRGEHGVSFGEDGSICPLCHQTITGDVHKRVKSVDQYINGSCSSEFQSAQEEFRRLCATLANRKTSAATITVSLNGVLSGEDMGIVTSAYNAIESLKTTSDNEGSYEVVNGMQLDEAKKVSAAKLDALNEEIDTACTYERTPISYKSMHEEDLRNTLLAALNATYKGDAMGEAFRNKGKTDICIERENRAAFVAECKMWTGQKELPDAVKQLDSYLTWRDCKTALIYFVRRKDFLSVVTTTETALKAIPAMRQVIKKDANEFKCSFASQSNPGQLVQIRVMLFNLFA